MHFNIIFPLAVALLSFTNQNTKNFNSTPLASSTETDSTFNVHLHIQHHYPYCGGAAPTEEMMNNYVAVSGTYILINHTNNSESNVLAKNGSIKIQLAPGRYSLRETYKNIPFNDFYAKHSVENGSNKQNRSEDCYKTWWESNLFEFEIGDTTKLIEQSTTTSSRCFIGINPCQIYTGPWPP